MLVHILGEPGGGLVFRLDKEAREDFYKNVLNRALNCYPDAHPDWKELADYLQHGRVLQDYRKLDKPRPE
jgi:hypothetical protein